MVKKTARNKIARIEVSAVVKRKDGTVEDLGVIARSSVSGGLVRFLRRFFGGRRA